MTRANRRPSSFGPAASRRAAFTFPELVIGMAITVICIGAMSSVMLAVSTGWKRQGASQGTHLTNRQAVVRTQNLVRDAKLIGLVRPGSMDTNTSDAACVMLWKADNSGGTANRTVQLSEMALVEHNRSQKEIRYYTVKFPASMTALQIAAANVNCTYADLTSGTAPETFKALSYVSYQVVAKDVVGAAFYSNQVLGQSSQLPTFEFQLKFERKGNTSQVYGSTALRNPDFKPTF